MVLSYVQKREKFTTVQFTSIKVWAYSLTFRAFVEHVCFRHFGFPDARDFCSLHPSNFRQKHRARCAPEALFPVAVPRTVCTLNDDDDDDDDDDAGDDASLPSSTGENSNCWDPVYTFWAEPVRVQKAMHLAKELPLGPSAKAARAALSAALTLKVLQRDGSSYRGFVRSWW